jgi:aminoglycoside phosphotransferase
MMQLASMNLSNRIWPVMPINEGVNIDLQFLILEVKKQAQASLSMAKKPTAKKVARIIAREDYIDNLKNTLVNKSYFHIHRQVDELRQMNYFKTLITISYNLERCANFFEAISSQLMHVQDIENLNDFKISPAYNIIFRVLDLIYPSFSNNDLDMAQKICDYEQELDDFYDAAFILIRNNLHQRHQIDDMLIILNIVRYLERTGDSFLNIGEAIFNINVGEKMGISQFRDLRKGLESQAIDIRENHVEFLSIMNTRSGSRVAKIKSDGCEPKSVFYKKGAKGKIDEELAGLALWEKKFPGMTPEVLWYKTRKKHATLLLEFIEGEDLLNLLINQRDKADRALTILTEQLTLLWNKSKKKRVTKSTYISQLKKRKLDVQFVHGNLFTLDEDIDKLMQDAKRIEKNLKTPFSTLVHGDFNVDNIIFQSETDNMFLVDVHRSGYGDYAQDISVFLVSNFRVPIFSIDVRSRLNEANQRVFECALAFAKKNEDKTFEARLALGLFRSLITSTRFLLDQSFSEAMFQRAVLILREILAEKDHLDQFSLNPSYFTYQ